MTTQEVKMSNGEKVVWIIMMASKKTGISKFSEDALYRVFDKLTKEFPKDFPRLHFYPLSGGFPYCGTFEDILFRAGVADCLIRTGWRMNEFLIEKRAIETEEKIMKKYHSETMLNELNKIVDRFIELIPKEER